MKEIIIKCFDEVTPRKLDIMYKLGYSACINRFEGLVFFFKNVNGGLEVGCDVKVL